MEAWQILLIIIVIVLSFYLSGFFIVLTYAFDFSARLKRRITGINVILVEKREIIVRVYERFKKEGTNFDERFEQNLEQFLKFELKRPRFEECKTAISLQKSLQSRLFYEFQTQTSLKNDPEIKGDCNMLEDLDRNIRTSCSLFNSDVAGYNYWINIFGYRWLFYLLRKKPMPAIV